MRCRCFWISTIVGAPEAFQAAFGRVMVACVLPLTIVTLPVLLRAGGGAPGAPGAVTGAAAPGPTLRRC
jgi:hypothetical protein